MLDCPVMQCRQRYPVLFSPAKNTMQLFMWQRNSVGVAHSIMNCCDVLGALMMLLRMHQSHLHEPWRLVTFNFTHSCRWLAGTRAIKLARMRRRRTESQLQYSSCFWLRRPSRLTLRYCLKCWLSSVVYHSLCIALLDAVC